MISEHEKRQDLFIQYQKEKIIREHGFHDASCAKKLDYEVIVYRSQKSAMVKLVKVIAYKHFKYE
jgi:hypothetical protein